MLCKDFLKTSSSFIGLVSDDLWHVSLSQHLSQQIVNCICMSISSIKQCKYFQVIETYHIYFAVLQQEALSSCLTYKQQQKPGSPLKTFLSLNTKQLSQCAISMYKQTVGPTWLHKHQLDRLFKMQIPGQHSLLNQFRVKAQKFTFKICQLILISQICKPLC